MQFSPIQWGNWGSSLIGGFSKVLLPLSRARDWKTAINVLKRKGVIMRKIKFLGFLKVNIKFLWMSNLDCWMAPKGSTGSDY